jgi:hypothetical protein
VKLRLEHTAALHQEDGAGGTSLEAGERLRMLFGRTRWTEYPSYLGDTRVQVLVPHRDYDMQVMPSSGKQPSEVSLRCH